MPVHHLVRQAELQTDLAYFVLEEFAQRLDQRHAHVLRQPADVVMRLDDVRLAGGRAGRFDHVRIDRALRQPLDALELVRLFVEHLDELAADDLALLFRVADTVQRVEEALGRVDAYHANTQVVAERVHHLVALVVAQQPVVDEHAGELVTDRFVKKRGNDGRIDAAGQAEQDLGIANLLAHPGDAVRDDIAGRPVAGAAADVVDEALHDRLALQRVSDFRVELHTVETPAAVLHRCKRRVPAAGGRLEAGRE